MLMQSAVETNPVPLTNLADDNTLTWLIGVKRTHLDDRCDNENSQNK